MIVRRFKFAVLAILILLTFTLGTIFVSAESSGQSHENSSEDSAFFDPLFNGMLEKYHIPGISFVMVQNSDVTYEEGYGYSDIENKIPVDPDNTCFFIGSVGKLFTTTAVMQLYERGLIGLNTDVNQYLDFKVKTLGTKPVTVADLLTHTGGFDESSIGIAAQNEKDVVPLGTFLAEHMPPCIRTPGETYCYSNYGMALAGYLVERVSGVHFNTYIEKNILEPLDMNKSSAGYSKNTSSNMARGYTFENRKFVPVIRDYLNISPAAPIYATAGDMAHFVIAQLQNGNYGGARILNPDTINEMQTQHFTYGKNIPGIAYGFHEMYQNNLRVIEHTGGWTGFTSYLFLIPEKKTGFFFTCNADEDIASGALNELANQFLNHFYPSAEEDVSTGVGIVSKTDLQRFNGTYGYIQYGHGNIEKISSLLSQYTINLNEDGTLAFASAFPAEGKIYNFTEVEPLLYKEIDTDDLMLFKVDDINQITGMSIGLSSFDKLTWYQTAKFQTITTFIFIVVFLIGFILWLAGIIMRKKNKKYIAEGIPTRHLSGIVCGINIIFITGFAISFVKLQSIGVYGLPLCVKLLLVIPFISIVLAIMSAIFIIMAWIRGNGKIVWRIYHTLIAFVSMTFIPFLYYWNLIGFRY